MATQKIEHDVGKHGRFTVNDLRAFTGSLRDVPGACVVEGRLAGLSRLRSLAVQAPVPEPDTVNDELTGEDAGGTLAPMTGPAGPIR